MKSNAAASQSSGRRGILLSLLLPLILLAHAPARLLEQTERPQALMKMRLPNSRWNFGAWKTETIRTSCAFCFNDPKRELRQLFFHIGGVESRKIEIHDAFRFSRELFRHQRLSAGNGSPIDMTLRFAVHVGAHSRKIVAFASFVSGRPSRRCTKVDGSRASPAGLG